MGLRRGGAGTPRWGETGTESGHGARRDGAVARSAREIVVGYGRGSERRGDGGDETLYHLVGSGHMYGQGSGRTYGRIGRDTGKRGFKVAFRSDGQSLPPRTD